MFPELDRLIAEIRAVRDTPAARALCMDCRAVALRCGEAEGVALARVVLAGVTEYEAHERALAALSTTRAGTVLGTALPPAGVEWWGLLEDGTVVSSGEKRAGQARYWCLSAEGWWRIPQEGP